MRHFYPYIAVRGDLLILNARISLRLIVDYAQNEYNRE